MRAIGIAWAEDSPRLNDLVAELGGSVILISWMSGIKILAPLKYILLAIKTIFLNIKYKPDIVIAQNPPIFCPLSAYIYAILFKKVLVIDHHSLSLVRRGIIWKILATFELWLMKRALINTVIHDGYKRLCSELGISSFTIPDAVPEFSCENQKFSEFTAISPLGGHPDEDIETLVELSVALKGKCIRLIITGKAKRDLANIRYLGFLPRDKYIQVLSMAHVGLCLVKGNEWTLPYSTFEFMGAQIPFLTSKTLGTMIFGDFFLVGKKEEILTKLSLFKEPRVYSESLRLLANLKQALKNKRKTEIEAIKKIISKSLKV